MNYEEYEKKIGKMNSHELSKEIERIDYNINNNRKKKIIIAKKIIETLKSDKNVLLHMRKKEKNMS